MFAALQSVFIEKKLHEQFSGIADEEDEVGQFHRNVLANLQETATTTKTMTMMLLSVI